MKDYKSPETGKTDNHMSHFYGDDEGVIRCLSCGVAGYNGWKEYCPNKEDRDRDLEVMRMVQAMSEEDSDKALATISNISSPHNEEGTTNDIV